MTIEQVLPSDAFVFFGATGDLAYKKIFPALQSMVKRGALNVPVIGVARQGWNVEQLRARARASVQEHSCEVIVIPALISLGPQVEAVLTLLDLLARHGVDPMRLAVRCHRPRQRRTKACVDGCASSEG